MSMFGYIDNDRNRAHRMAKDVLSPALGRPTEELESLLLFGSPEHCLEKIRALSEAGVKRIHFWPVSDYLEQIEIFRNEIVPYF
jgi:alkanesulfonate monooxygenase SsuD/methylene tetrahydromethanopterin reductase-like flavin-dependent oxidoreductase (luciferase family)